MTVFATTGLHASHSAFHGAFTVEHFGQTHPRGRATGLGGQYGSGSIHGGHHGYQGLGFGQMHMAVFVVFT